MTDIATEIVLPEERKESIEKEDCDKDSGNQSGEEAEMENGIDDPTCGNNVDCENEKQGPHCHIDKPSQGSRNGSRRNSIAEEIKSKIASVSRRNSIGSRRSSGAGASRRGSIQSIKEDPTCEEECKESREGPHCHVEKIEDPTCVTDKPCAESKDGPHCHVEKIEDPTCVTDKSCPESKEGAHCHVEKIEDPTCQKDVKCPESNEGSHCHVEKIEDPTCKKESDCAETKQGSHCHVERPVSDDDDDVISENSQNIEESQKKQSLQNSPEKVVNKATTVDLTERSVAPSPAETHSNESTPLTARKVIQTPVNMKETETTIQETEVKVPITMPPSEHTSPTKEPATNGISAQNSPTKERDGLKSSKGRKTLKSESEGPPKVLSRAQSKSRPSSPSDENRRSRYSSKERKSSEKIQHEMPDVSIVKSKLDDKNPDYKPPTSQRKIETRKLVWKAESKIENKNMDYRRKSMGISQEDGLDKKPKKIENHKLDWKAEAKTVTRNTAYTPPTKSEKKVESHKINWKAESKINSRENINYQPGGVGSISPTRSANNVRRARSRSSHGNSRAVSNGSAALGASQENVVNGVRLTASAAPYIARRSSRPRDKVSGNEVNGQNEG